MAEKLTHVVRTGNVLNIGLSDSVRRRARDGQGKNLDIRLNKRTVRLAVGLSSAAALLVAAGMFLNEQAEAGIEQYQQTDSGK
jgi:homoserine kinase